jgi:hypothetical protein
MARRPIRPRLRATREATDTSDTDRPTVQQALLDTRAWFQENPIRSFVITAPIFAVGGLLTTVFASGLPTAVLVAVSALGGACVAVLSIGAWMWGRAFPTHNARARAALRLERANGEAVAAEAKRRAAVTEERLKGEIENALADARRGHARADLYRCLRDGRAYVAAGMRPGVSAVAPLGVLINWTSRVADNLKLLGINVPKLQSGGSTAVAAGSASDHEVQTEFERRLDVLEKLIDDQLV